MNKNIKSLTPILALRKYHELAKDHANHSEMIKDKTTLSFLAYVLDSKEEDVLNLSLDTLLLLTEIQSNIEAIRSTFGVIESVQAILDNKKVENSVIQGKAVKLLEKLKKCNSPIKNVTKPVPKKKMKTLVLHIHGLYLETQKELEDILTKKMKGVHSILVDVEHQKCTVTVYENVDPKNIALVLSENTDMEAELICRNKCNQEILVPLIENDKTLDLEELPEYLDEKDSPVKEKAVSSAKDIRITASEWFCSAAGFLQRTFYW